MTSFNLPGFKECPLPNDPACIVRILFYLLNGLHTHVASLHYHTADSCTFAIEKKLLGLKP